MLELTDAAADAVKELLASATGHGSSLLRFVVVDGELRAALDEKRPGDNVVKQHGVPLIVMDRSTTDKLYGHQLDVDQGGSNFLLK